MRVLLNIGTVFVLKIFMDHLYLSNFGLVFNIVSRSYVIVIALFFPTDFVWIISTNSEDGSCVSNIDSHIYVRKVNFVVLWSPMGTSVQAFLCGGFLSVIISTYPRIYVRLWAAQEPPGTLRRDMAAPWLTTRT